MVHASVYFILATVKDRTRRWHFCGPTVKGFRSVERPVWPGRRYTPNSARSFLVNLATAMS